MDGHLRAIAGPDALSLWTDVPTYGKELTTRAEFTVREGQQVPFLLMWHPSHQTASDPPDPLAALAETETSWREWCSRGTYQGPWREQVMRSLITLKALTYAPTGGIVAAPTTSLPEKIGSVRNWDYRYCWLRDATFTLYALMIGGRDGMRTRSASLSGCLGYATTSAALRRVRLRGRTAGRQLSPGVLSRNADQLRTKSDAPPGSCRRAQAVAYGISRRTRMRSTRALTEKGFWMNVRSSTSTD